MSNHRYRYNLDRRTYYRTLLHIAIFTAAGAGFYTLYEGGFISAWFTSFIVALMLLMSLSIPRYITVNSDNLTINCLLDTTEIALDEIVTIEKISPRKIGWVFPIFGGNGFFGYYGHFFDLRSFQRVVIYASEWRGMVEIVDIYEDHYYVSCRERDRLIREVREYMKSEREEA
ncbi:MAG: PH domain-containing protein [Rikenellaceae bacterium]